MNLSISLIIQIESVTMTYGELKPPIGSTKLNIIKLIAKLIGTNNSKLNEEIVHFKILNIILVCHI